MRARQYHISDVVVYPQCFGLSQADIDRAFASHGEPRSAVREGAARGALIARVLRSGWIRIRGHRGYVSVTVHRLSGDVRDRLRAWGARKVAAGKLHPLDRLHLVELSKRENAEFSGGVGEVLEIHAADLPSPEPAGWLRIEDIAGEG
ncbi:hypothetical protein [Arhodomonas sp. KWT]|uniref:hypothetical protein n=1 Tax=Arhodomonas sp. KWT TaxID=2679915 RepID=UPI0013D1B20B|nr:hypothetical protein [Arhodomonas sp. KWT]